MSWDHGTYGWEEFDGFFNALVLLGVANAVTSHGPTRSVGYDFGPTERQLRQVTFVGSDGVSMTCREYLIVDDGDCDGRSRVGIAVFVTANPPVLWTTVLDGGHESYPGVDTSNFEFNWETQQARPLPENAEV